MVLQKRCFGKGELREGAWFCSFFSRLCLWRFDMWIFVDLGFSARGFRASGRDQVRSRTGGFPIALDLRECTFLVALGDSAQENPPPTPPYRGRGVPQPCCPGLQTASGFFKRNKSQSALQPYGLQFKLEPLKPPERLLPSLGREGRGRVLTPRKQSLSKRAHPRRVQRRSESLWPRPQVRNSSVAPACWGDAAQQQRSRP